MTSNQRLIQNIPELLAGTDKRVEFETDMIFCNMLNLTIFHLN